MRLTGSATSRFGRISVNIATNKRSAGYMTSFVRSPTVSRCARLSGFFPKNKAFNANEPYTAHIRTVNCCGRLNHDLCDGLV